MILLNRGYAGYAAGAIVQLSTQEEAALVAQGLASYNAGPVTPGDVTTIKTFGRVGIDPGSNNVTVFNSAFTTESKFVAYLSNLVADPTALSIILIQPGAGSVTFVTVAGVTNSVSIDWVLLNVSGDLPPN